MILRGGLHLKKSDLYRVTYTGPVSLVVLLSMKKTEAIFRRENLGYIYAYLLVRQIGGQIKLIGMPLHKKNFGALVLMEPSASK